MKVASIRNCNPTAGNPPDDCTAFVSPVDSTLLAYWRKLLACVLTRRGFAMDIKLIAKPLAFALFTVSGSRFDGRVAFRSAREAAFGPSRRPTAGFRRLRWRAHLHQKRRNYPMDPYRRQPTPIVTAFPRQTQVRNTLARQS